MTPTAASSKTAEFVKPTLDDNPYATPRILDVDREPHRRRSNFELQRLGYTLRAHGILTVFALSFFAATYVTTIGVSHEIGWLMLMGAMVICVVMALLTVQLAFTVFPFFIAVLVMASLLVPVTWPFTFIAMHWWGRKTLNDHSMQIGFFKGPQYVAKIAGDGQ